MFQCAEDDVDRITVVVGHERVRRLQWNDDRTVGKRNCRFSENGGRVERGLSGNVGKVQDR